MSTMKDAVTLLDYSPDALVAIDEFDAVRWAIAESDRAAAEHRQRQIAAGELPAEIGSPVFAAEDLTDALASAELRLSHAEHPQDSGRGARRLAVAGFGQASSYAGRLAVLLSDLEDSRAARKTTILASYQGRRLCDLLNERGLGAAMLEDVDDLPAGAVVVVRRALAEGWVLDDPKPSTPGRR